MPGRRGPRFRLRLPRVRIDVMNLLIGLVVVVNLLLVGFGVRQCASRKGPEPLASRADLLNPAVTEPAAPSAGEPRPAVAEPPENRPFQVEVLNGCGVPKVADKITALLREKGFDVVKTGNYDNFNVPKTLVIDRRGGAKRAQSLASALGLRKTDVIAEVSELHTVDATVVLGKDFRTLSGWKTLEKRRGPN
jgi:hypothetical protein